MIDLEILIKIGGLLFVTLALFLSDCAIMALMYVLVQNKFIETIVLIFLIIISLVILIFLGIKLFNEKK